MVKKFLFSLAIGLVFSLCLPLQSFAQTATDQLQKRIDQLAQEVQQLKVLLQEQQKAREEDKARVQKVEQKVDQAEKSKPAATTVAGTASSIISEFKFKPYGFIKLDAAYDDSRLYPDSGNFAFYVPTEQSLHKNDNSFSMTARQTQLGLYILAPETYAWQAKGRIEMDFYGDGTQHENKPDPLLRQAYVELTKKNISLLAGQTNDLISPLAPNTLNYTVGWAAGNIGYRRPQLRFTYTHPFNDRNKLITALALARTEGTANEDLDLDKKNDGEDVGFPTVQARIAYAAKLFCLEKESVFGISGHYGKEEIDWGLIKTSYDQKRMKSWSINGDFEVLLSQRLSIKGEGFVGENLDDYLGGIIQGVNSTTRTVIKSMGGWTQLSYQYNKWKYNAGFGIDDPRNQDLDSGNRSKNAFYFGNFYYNLIPPVNLCLEYSFWDTNYIKKASGTDNRIQTSVIYNW